MADPEWGGGHWQTRRGQRCNELATDKDGGRTLPEERMRHVGAGRVARPYNPLHQRLLLWRRRGSTFLTAVDNVPLEQICPGLWDMLYWSRNIRRIAG